MATARDEDVAKEITVALVSKLEFGTGVVERADAIGEAVGKLYTKIVEAVGDANK